MKEVFFHLGMHKTGTSTIQNSLYKNNAELANYGVKYANTGIYLNEPDVGYRHALLIYTNKWEENCFQLVSEVMNSTASKIVVSCEAWSRPSAYSKLLFLVRLLEKKGVQCTGVVYLRNWNNFTRSYYREFCIRRGNYEYFDKFYQLNQSGTFDYLKVATGLRKIFNKNLIFRKFDSIKDLAKDFHDIIGIYSNSLKVDGFRHNVGISARDTEIKRVANELSVFKDVNVLKDMISCFYGDNLILSDNFIESPGYLFNKVEPRLNDLSLVLDWSLQDVENLYNISVQNEMACIDVKSLTSLYQIPILKNLHNFSNV